MEYCCHFLTAFSWMTVSWFSDSSAISGEHDCATVSPIVFAYVCAYEFPGDFENYTTFNKTFYSLAMYFGISSKCLVCALHILDLYMIMFFICKNVYHINTPKT